MAIDRNPAEGRYILLESIFHDEFFGRAALITKISNSRICHREVRNGELSEKGIKSFCSKFAAVCDTLEEVDRLQAFSKACKQEIRDLRAKNKEKLKKIMAGD
jgi:hypothetical protein